MAGHSAVSNILSPQRSNKPNTTTNIQSVRSRKSPQKPLAVTIRQEWRDVDCFESQTFALAPWVTGPGIQISDRLITQTKNFFNYTAKSTTNTFSGASIAMKVSNGESMQCEFDAKVICGGILIGVALEDIPLTSNWLEDTQCLDRVWYYASPKGCFYNGPRQLTAELQPPTKESIRNGDRVKIEVDTKSSTATFFINGKLIGKISFRGESVRPSAYLFAKGSSIYLHSVQVRKLCNVESEENEDDNALGHDVNGSSMLWSRCHTSMASRDSTSVIHNVRNVAFPSYSSVTRLDDGCGPRVAVLRYFASTRWTSGACTGKYLKAEFELKRRVGSMEFGVVVASVPLSGTWCDRSYHRKAYWYSWSGALREGCEVKAQTSKRFFGGDTIRIEIDLFHGTITFVLNNHIVGTLIVDAIEAIRQLEDKIISQKGEISNEIANISEMKREISLGRFSLVPAVNLKIESLGSLQQALKVSAEELPHVAESCLVELFPAISMCCPGDQVLVDGAVAFQAQESEPAKDALVERQNIEKVTETLPIINDGEYLEILGKVQASMKQSKSPLLELLSSSELSALTDGHYLTLEADAVLRGFEGEEPRTLFVLVEGALSVRVEGALALKEVAVLDAPGATFGELAVTHKKAFKATVVALRRSAVLQVSGALARAVLAGREDLVPAFNAEVQARVHANSVAGEAWRSMFLLHRKGPEH